MTIRHLKIFVAVCNNETLTATAESMNISQPSISQAIIQMEKYYNVKLFDRMSNKLYLTETGRKLLGYAKYITELFSEMENSMRTELVSPVIRIGSSITIGRCLLPDYIAMYRKLNPKMVINVCVQSSGLLEKKILDNSIDFALVEGPVTSSQICVVPFMDDELILVCGKEYPLSSVKSITVNELSGLDFILREGESGSRAVFDAVMMSNGIDYNVIWHSDSTEAIKNAVMKNLGVTVMSRRLIAKELEAGDLKQIPIENIVFKRKFNLIYHQNKYLSAGVKAIMDFILSNKI